MSYTIKDVVKSDFCTGCGVCTSESESSTMEWNSYGFLVPKLDNSFNGTAIHVCPFNPQPKNSVKDEDKLAQLLFRGKESSMRTNREIGLHIETYVGHSVEFRESSSSGGLATYILNKLIEKGEVQHLFTVMAEDGYYNYNWYSPSQGGEGDTPSITDTSKTRYYPVTMERLFKEIEHKEGKVAVVGVPCFIKAIRLKQFYHPNLREKLVFCVGIFCGGVKSAFYTQYLMQKIEAKPVQGTANPRKDEAKPVKSTAKPHFHHVEYRIKEPNSNALDYSFGYSTQDGQHKQLKMNTLGDMWGTGLFKNNACDFCDDITAELGDISLGDAWFPPHIWDGRGTSVVITRSKLAQTLIIEGIESGELQLQKLPLQTLLKSLTSTIYHRQKASKFRLNYKSCKTGKTLPYKRERLFESISLPYRMVQIARMKLRSKSLRVWRRYGTATQFERRVWFLKKRLALYTKVYHLYERRIKRG